MTDQRDIKKEGDEIKQALTQHTPHTFTFTSAIESVYEGFQPYKIDGSKVTTYVPDFFYLGDISVRLFESLKGDRNIQKNDDLCPFGFTTYIFYACMAHLFRSLATFEDVDLEIIQINTIFENAGFLDVPIPTIFSQWFQAVGNFTSNIFGRVIRPTLIVPESQGVYYDNYFMHGSTAHLLPNFRALFAKAVLLSTDTTFTLGAAFRNHNAFANPTVRIQSNLFTDNGSVLFRAFNSRIPGIAHLIRRQVSPQFASIAAALLSRDNVANNLLVRYLQLDTKMLRFLATTYTPFCKMTDHFTTSISPSYGSDLLECYLVEESDTRPIIGPQYDSEDSTKVVLPAVFDHVFRIKSKYNIINGYMMTASIVPVIRISVEETRIPNSVAATVYPDEVQDPYFSSAHEYQTVPLTIQEAHARFSRKK